MPVTGLANADPRALIGTSEVGLLTATGAYDVERYPWAYEFWKRQQQTHWMGEEVPLGADIKDWASDRVTDADRSLLTQIFRFFTQSDVRSKTHGSRISRTLRNDFARERIVYLTEETVESLYLDPVDAEQLAGNIVGLAKIDPR